MKKIYAKFVDAPLNTIDKGDLFKKGIFYSLLLITAAIVLGGVFGTISGLFGDYGYFSMISEFPGFQMVRAIVASLFTIIISLASLVAIAAIFFKRANDLNAKEYNGLLQFLYKELFPTMIKIYGEVLAILPITLSLTGFFSVLFATWPYSPLGNYAGMMFGMFGLDGIMGMFSGAGAGIDGFVAYIKTFGMVGIGGIIVSVLLSFSILISTYVALEIYNYTVGVIITFVKFIPRFAFPFWVQKSERSGTADIDVNDL